MFHARAGFLRAGSAPDASRSTRGAFFDRFVPTLKARRINATPRTQLAIAKTRRIFTRPLAVDPVPIRIDLRVNWVLILLKQVLYPGDRNLSDFGGTFMPLRRCS